MQNQYSKQVIICVQKQFLYVATVSIEAYRYFHDASAHVQFAAPLKKIIFPLESGQNDYNWHYYTTKMQTYFRRKETIYTVNSNHVQYVTEKAPNFAHCLDI